MGIAIDKHDLSARVRAIWVALALAFALLVANSPALAHKGKKDAPAGQSQQAAPNTPASAASAASAARTTDQQQAGEMMDGIDMGMDRSKMSFFERLIGWFGRIHPMVVHFPIAFFPAALLTAIVGRRRPSFAAPVQFLVVAGGIFVPIAAATGWLTGLTADPEPILAYHRWLGVTVGLAGAGLGLWAWRRPWEDRGAGMILALTVMTIAIAVQGFLGAGLTHGMDHMMF